ncbi:hypothetical protein V6N13_009445 [Hibiscus sabdariffa]
MLRKWVRKSLGLMDLIVAQSGSSNHSGPEVKIGVGFKDKDEDFKSFWANMLDKTFNSGKGFNLSGNGKAMSDGENEKAIFLNWKREKEKEREGK